MYREFFNFRFSNEAIIHTIIFWKFDIRRSFPHYNSSHFFIYPNFNDRTNFGLKNLAAKLTLVLCSFNISGYFGWNIRSQLWGEKNYTKFDIFECGEVKCGIMGKRVKLEKIKDYYRRPIYLSYFVWPPWKLLLYFLYLIDRGINSRTNGNTLIVHTN